MKWLNTLFLATMLIVSSCSRAAQADAQLMAHPDDNTAKIEYFVEQPLGAGPWPTIIFLHGYQPPSARIGGRAFVNWGVLQRYREQGYLAVSVSLPGFGGSTGQEDYAGPFAQHAVQSVIEKLRSDQLAMPSKVLIHGVSLGAVTGALIGANDNQIAGLVLISGLYDFPQYFSGRMSSGTALVKRVIDQQTGGSMEALRARSALPLAAQIKASTLILNGAKDDRTDPNQAVRFGEAINKSGGKAIAHIYPDFGHEIPVSAREAEVQAFIDATLK